MVTVTFDEVSIKGRVRVKCSHPGCNKMVQRTKKFHQTLNPWNTNKDGNVKTREQIRADLFNEREKWEREQTNLLCRDHG